MSQDMNDAFSASFKQLQTAIEENKAPLAVFYSSLADLGSTIISLFAKAIPSIIAFGNVSMSIMRMFAKTTSAAMTVFNAFVITIANAGK